MNRLEFVDSGGNYSFRTSQIPPFLEEVNKNSPHLQRLVLVAQRQCYRDRQHPNPTLLEDSLFDFVTKMKRLIALCLVGFEMHPIDRQQLEYRFRNEILPERPPLWHHLHKEELPKATDATAPKVHLDEIVDPFDPFFAPPF